MKGIIALCLVALLAGCSAVQIAPKPKGQQLIVTPVKGATAQIVAGQQFQQKVIQVKPVGNKWSSAKLDVAVGAPLTKSIQSYVSSAMPGARIGDRDDGAPASVKIEPVSADIELGTDDSAAYRTGMFIPLASFAMTADTVAMIKVGAEVSYCGGEKKKLSVVGRSSKNMNYAAIGFPELEEAMAVAIDDAARQLSEQVSAGAMNCQI